MVAVADLCSLFDDAGFGLNHGKGTSWSWLLSLMKMLSLI